MSEESGWKPSEGDLGAVRQIDAVLAKIPEQLAAYLAIEPVRPRPGSTIAGDDVCLDPFPASALVATCLASAADCLDAIQVLMRNEYDDPHLWAFAQYPLLRSALEASAQALWLLAPDDEHERVVRNLRVRATESGQDATLFALVDAHEVKAASATVGKEQEALLAKIATRNAVRRGEYAKPISYSEIVREGCASVGGDGAQELAVWRLMSGFAHSCSSRSEMFSTRIPLLVGSEPTGTSAIMANPAIVLLALTTAQLAFTNAVALTRERAALLE